MPSEKATKARYKSCVVVTGESKDFKIVSKNFLQCGKIYYEEPELDFKEDRFARSKYFVCNDCYEKYDLIGRYRLTPPASVEYCDLCKDYTELKFKASNLWAVNFHSQTWCHKGCLQSHLRRAF